MYIYKQQVAGPRGHPEYRLKSIMANRWPRVSTSADILDRDIQGPGKGVRPNLFTLFQPDRPPVSRTSPPPGTPERGLPSMLKRWREHQDCSLECSDQLMPRNALQHEPLYQNSLFYNHYTKFHFFTH